MWSQHEQVLGLGVADHSGQQVTTIHNIYSAQQSPGGNAFNTQLMNKRLSTNGSFQQVVSAPPKSGTTVCQREGEDLCRQVHRLPNSIVTYVCVSTASAGWWQSPSARVHESSGGWWRLRHTWTRPHARETPQLVADLDTSPQPQPSSLLCYFQSLIQYLYVSI